MTAFNEGKEVSQVVRFRPFYRLMASNRNTADSGYGQLKVALERLAGTRTSTISSLAGKKLSEHSA